MIDREKIRIADIKLMVIKKRCRKEELEYFDGIGKTDEEAIANLKATLRAKIGDFRAWRQFGCNVFIYDGERKHGDYGVSICRPLTPWAHPQDTRCFSIDARELLLEVVS